ncbi:MAG TPA: hypothetical protein VES42_09570, partial [Pilimelia sp.]|nr:hypothetical protein [Pilimelia sp.]
MNPPASRQPANRQPAAGKPARGEAPANRKATPERRPSVTGEAGAGPAGTTPRLSLADGDPAELAVDALVIGLHADLDGGPPQLADGTGGLAAAFDGRLTEALGLLGATGSAGEVTK